jgi:hypothetical protein
MTRRGLVLGLGLSALSGIGRTAEAPQLVAAGAWSKPVVDNEGFALRGRLVLYDKRYDATRRDTIVYIELQEASESAARPLQLYGDMGRNDFRREYLPGLHCELRDKAEKALDPVGFPFGGAVPRSQWVILPADSTLRLRASPWGIWRPNARAICSDIGTLWIIPDDDRKPYYLSGTFTAEVPKDLMPPTDDHVWHGTLLLPPAKIINDL